MKGSKTMIGIDVGSESVAVAVLHSVDQQEKQEEKFNNTSEGFEELHQWLQSQKVRVEESVVVLEATGVYGESLCYYLSSRRYQVSVESPLKVKRAFAHSAHKNDTVDARQI